MSWSAGSTRAWRELRALVLQRDRAEGWSCRAHEEGWCARAGRPGPHACTHVPTHVHHTRGRAVTGDDPRHLVASCATCNLHIGEPKQDQQGDPPCKIMTAW